MVDPTRYEVPVTATTEAGETAPVMLSYDPDELDAVIGELEELIKDLDSDLEFIDDMFFYAVPPSRDWASVAFMNRHEEGLNRLRASLDSVLDEARNLHDKHVKARDDLDNTEQHNADAMQQAMQEPRDQ